MKLFQGNPLRDFATLAQTMVDRWNKRGPEDRNVRAAIVIAITDPKEDDKDPQAYGRARYVEGHEKDLARAARAAASALWKVNPVLCFTFMHETRRLMMDELGQVAEKWMRDRGIKPIEDDDVAGDMFNVDDEVAYSLYYSSREKGTSHETLVGIDPECSRFLERYEREKRDRK